MSDMKLKYRYCTSSELGQGRFYLEYDLWAEARHYPKETGGK